MLPPDVAGLEVPACTLPIGCLVPNRDSSVFNFFLHFGVLFARLIFLLELVPRERDGLARTLFLPGGRPGFLFTTASSCSELGRSPWGADAIPNL